MKNQKKHIIILSAVMVFNSCATVFMPSKQNVTIKTSSDDAKVYVNNEKFGEGKVSTKKIEKGSVKQVVITYGDDYIPQNEVIVPKAKRSPGYYVGQAFNIPFCAVLYGFYAISADSRASKTHAYEKEITFNEHPQKFPKKSEISKYVYLSNISLQIDDADKEILLHEGILKDNLESSIKLAEIATEELALKKEQKEQKKKKKKEYLVVEKKDLKYEDVIFTDKLMTTLYKGGYIDTINNVFRDNNNTLIIEGKIDKIDMFAIKPNKRYNSGAIYQTRTDLTWYIKNNYGEIMDSITDLAKSENFAYGKDVFKQSVGNSITNSFYNLLEEETFQKYSKIEKDFNPNLEVTKLNTPTAIVKEKRDAMYASVIVKTDNGHGSGFAITNDGYIVTNYHVVSDGKTLKNSNVTIIDADGNELEGEIVKVNKYQDVALIKVDHEFTKAFYCNDEKTFRKMDDVYTIGAPKSINLGQSISNGMISNERKINNNYLIQLSMSVNSGNSGGPIFDSVGNLHGVVVSKLIGKNTEGVSFAVPSYLLTEYLNLKF